MTGRQRRISERTSTRTQAGEAEGKPQLEDNLYSRYSGSWGADIDSACD